MKFFVNENCIGCGLCVSICPEVFQMSPEGVSKASGNAVDKKVEKSAEKAMHDCPVDAIEQR